MLASMLSLVNNARCRARPDEQADVLHPLRVMGNLKMKDEELNCIALGHELLNRTTTSISDLVVAGMSDRVINGLILMKHAATVEETLDNICTSHDTMIVGLQCLLDRGALCDTDGLSRDKARTMKKYYKGYLRIAEGLNVMERDGFQRPGSELTFRTITEMSLELKKSRR